MQCSRDLCRASAGCAGRLAGCCSGARRHVLAGQSRWRWRWPPACCWRDPFNGCLISSPVLPTALPLACPSIPPSPLEFQSLPLNLSCLHPLYAVARDVARPSSPRRFPYLFPFLPPHFFCATPPPALENAPPPPNRSACLSAAFAHALHSRPLWQCGAGAPAGTPPDRRAAALPHAPCLCTRCRTQPAPPQEGRSLPRARNPGSMQWPHRRRPWIPVRSARMRRHMAAASVRAGPWDPPEQQTCSQGHAMPVHAGPAVAPPPGGGHCGRRLWLRTAHACSPCPRFPAMAVQHPAP